ncbi:unnamed protein product, partial [Nesidiocoris tenuis]
MFHKKDREDGEKGGNGDDSEAEDGENGGSGDDGGDESGGALGSESCQVYASLALIDKL